MKKKKIIKRFSIIIGVFLIIYILYSAFDIWLYGNVNEMTEADAVIVLGAGVLDDKPSPVFQERINHGIWLYKNGYVNKIIFTGGKSKNNEYSDSYIARQYAIENMVSPEDIYIEEDSAITQENISYAKQIVENNNISTVIIVSDPLHMKRAMLMAKDNNLIAYSSPTPTTRYKTLKTKLPFLGRELFFYIGYKIIRLFS